MNEIRANTPRPKRGVQKVMLRGKFRLESERALVRWRCLAGVHPADARQCEDHLALTARSREARTLP